MRIVVLTNEYEPHILGGLGIVATRLTNALQAYGHRLTVITSRRAKRVATTRFQDVTLLEYPRDSEYHSSKGQRYFPAPVLHDFESRVKLPDVVHIHSVQFDDILYDMQRKYSCYSIYTCHSLISLEGDPGDHQSRMAARQRAIIENVDAVVSPSQWQAQMLISQFPHIKDKVYVIPNGVTVSPSTRERPIHHALFVGRIIRSKGINELIEAMAFLCRRETDARLDIIGRGNDKFIARMKQFLRREHLSQCVRFLGHFNHAEVIDYMKVSGAVLVPSHNESFGLVALEAMASGTPLIATQAGGMQEFVDSSVATIIADHTSTQIARAVRSAWRNPERTEEKRLAALARAQNYSWEAIALQYDALLRGTN